MTNILYNINKLAGALQCVAEHDGENMASIMSSEDRVLRERIKELERAGLVQFDKKGYRGVHITPEGREVMDLLMRAKRIVDNCRKSEELQFSRGWIG